MLIALSSIALGCSEKKVSTQELNARISPEIPGPPEPDYCSQVQNFSSSVTISGLAQFIIRPIKTSGLGAGLQAPDTDNPKPIRYAEVRALDSNGNVVQCGQTNASGNFSLSLPQSQNSITIHIMARANHSKLKISVLDAPENNNVYSLKSNVKADASKSITMTAQATGDLLAGAFNIYDQVLNANEYIRSEIGTSFVANKVSAYWKAGFNPGDYVNTGPISFYYPGFNRMFILGGVNGDTDNTDTDHFDNSIIIHEYAHFLEDNYAVSNSPGGAHNGNKQIDARLAWSEGFANFFNAAVRTYISGDATAANYVDTIGNSSGSTSIGIYVDIESYQGCMICDRPGENGEGVFREFAITRFLYDTIDDTPNEVDYIGNWNANSNSPQLADGVGREGDTYRVIIGGTINLGSGSQTFSIGDLVYYTGSEWIKNHPDTDFDKISGKFPEIWSALTASDGFKSTKTSFRDVGLLNLIQFVENASDWSQLRIFHGMPNDTSNSRELRRAYAYQVDTTANGASSCVGNNFSIQPKSESNSYSNSNLLRNNDFFYYRHDGGSLTVTLKYKTASGSEANLDLYVYNNDGPFGYSNGLLGSATSFPDGNITTDETEVVNLGNRAAGDYLINVYALGGIGGLTNFEIRTGSGKLCPKDVNL